MTAMTQFPTAPMTPDRVTVSYKRRKVTAKVIVPQVLSGQRPLIVMHGISRDAAAMVRHFGPEAERTGRIIVAPRFDEKHWPIFQRPTRNARPDRALLALLDALALQYPGFDGPVDLFGYSGGAQLAHRTAMLYPHRFADVHLGSAGWYCLPDTDVPYPYGLAPAEGRKVNWRHCKLAMLPAFLNLNITVYTGDLDTERDEALRQNDVVDAAQGLTRFDRAGAYVHALRKAAKQHDITPQSRLVLLPECAHDFDECATRAGLARMVAGGRPFDAAAL